jgi:hypothetical protein
MKQAVIDRIEDHIAVLIVDNKPLNVPLATLPSGAKEGDYLQVEIQEGAVISATIDTAATEAARKRIAEKLERLRRGDHLKKE